jgi:hypothetical protein
LKKHQIFLISVSQTYLKLPPDRKNRRFLFVLITHVTHFALSLKETKWLVA